MIINHPGHSQEHSENVKVNVNAVLRIKVKIKIKVKVKDKIKLKIRNDVRVTFTYLKTAIDKDSENVRLAKSDEIVMLRSWSGLESGSWSMSE